MSKTVTFGNMSRAPSPPVTPSFTAGIPSRGAWFPVGTMDSVREVQIYSARLELSYSRNGNQFSELPGKPAKKGKEREREREDMYSTIAIISGRPKKRKKNTH